MFLFLGNTNGLWNVPLVPTHNTRTSWGCKIFGAKFLECPNSSIWGMWCPEQLSPLPPGKWKFGQYLGLWVLSSQEQPTLFENENECVETNRCIRQGYRLVCLLLKLLVCMPTHYKWTCVPHSGIHNFWRYWCCKIIFVDCTACFLKYENWKKLSLTTKHHQSYFDRSNDRYCSSWYIELFFKLHKKNAGYRNTTHRREIHVGNYTCRKIDESGY